MNIPRSALKIGRVLFEDDELLTIEIAKNEKRKLKIEDGDKFLTMLFVKNDPEDNSMVIWVPWEGE